ncbi:MAG: hypothetical protein Q8R15_03520 [Candidatus Micrarchaeota archaeon]|nr:hypothetical protein [Candidatus Micrarchaeota archaeon]
MSANILKAIELVSREPVTPVIATRKVIPRSGGPFASIVHEVIPADRVTEVHLRDHQFVEKVRNSSETGTTVHLKPAAIALLRDVRLHHRLETAGFEIILGPNQALRKLRDKKRQLICAAIHEDGSGGLFLRLDSQDAPKVIPALFTAIR